jgi:hypothetical protein
LTVKAAEKLLVQEPLGTTAAASMPLSIERAQLQSINRRGIASAKWEHSQMRQ